MRNNYTIKTEKIENKPGTWNSLKVTIYCDLGEIGSYIRTYSSMLNTFVPFMMNDREYALFSDDYTKTSVMSLPDCTKIATEETKYYRRDYSLDNDPNASDSITAEEAARLTKEDEENGVEYKYRRVHAREGFCPVDFYVPKTTYVVENVSGEFHDWGLDNDDAHYAFVAGCIWGDDTSWKVEALDLSEIHNGIVRRSAPFGYIELPHGMALKDAIDIDPEYHKAEVRKLGYSQDAFRVNTFEFYWMDRDKIKSNGKRHWVRD